MQEQMHFCLYPCPCGYHAAPVKECTCSYGGVRRLAPHLARCAAPSGPLPGRIGTLRCVAAPGLEYDPLSDE
jgi:hypothetical protein